MGSGTHTQGVGCIVSHAANGVLCTKKCGSSRQVLVYGPAYLIMVMDAFVDID